MWVSRGDKREVCGTRGEGAGSIHTEAWLRVVAEKKFRRWSVKFLEHRGGWRVEEKLGESRGPWSRGLDRVWSEIRKT